MSYIMYIREILLENQAIILKNIKMGFYMENRKWLAAAALLSSLLISVAMLLIYTNEENRQLRESIYELDNMKTQQQKVIEQKNNELKDYKTKAETFEQKIKEYGKLYRDAEQKLKSLLSDIPTIWPSTGRISAGFGNRSDPFTGREAFHEGLDIAAAYGSSIKAAAAGKVVTAGVISGYGNAVILSHGNGLNTLYGHASKLLVKVGQSVKKGQVIAKVGSTGRSTGPHLHFEVLVNNSPVDPMKYLTR